MTRERIFPEFENVHRFGRLLKMKQRLPMLITGIAGVAGYNAFAYFRHKYAEVWGQRPKKNWPLQGPGIVGVDLEDEQELRHVLRQGRFKTILNCGGSCAFEELRTRSANGEAGECTWRPVFVEIT